MVLSELLLIEKNISRGIPNHEYFNPFRMRRCSSRSMILLIDYNFGIKTELTKYLKRSCWCFGEFLNNIFPSTIFSTLLLPARFHQNCQAAFDHCEHYNGLLYICPIEESQRKKTTTCMYAHYRSGVAQVRQDFMTCQLS